MLFNSFRMQVSTASLSVVMYAFLTFAHPPIAKPDGFAEGTTGGGNASPKVVRSAAEFKSAVSDDAAAVIVVEGRINLGGAVSIGSNKTIVGANTSSGLFGGTINIRSQNVILQNLTLGPSSGDVLEVSGGSKVFIHKCEFYDSTDELCSIVRAADLVTVSWSKFHFTKPGSHSFAHLIGGRNDATGDRGKLRVTLHHNWYGQDVKGRIPRVRFGKVHIYNNYVNAVGAGYCIGTGKECNIRVEAVHFDGVNGVWKDHGGSSDGQIGWKDLKFTNGSTQPTYMPNKYPVFDAPYSFKVDNVEDIKNIVMEGAGNKTTTTHTIINKNSHENLVIKPDMNNTGSTQLIDFTGRIIRLNYVTDYSDPFPDNHAPAAGAYILKQSPTNSQGTKQLTIQKK